MSTRQAQVKSDLLSVRQILSTDFRYKVPPHQRDFSWTLEEIVQLWEDIIYAIQEDVPEYFLGTIVVQEDRQEKTRIIIDGQQRLATLIMILSSIRTVYVENDDERADEVYKEYLGMRDRRTRVTDSRLSLNEVNEPYFQRLVIENASDADIQQTAGDRTISPSNVLLGKGIQHIRSLVRQFAKSGKKYDSFLLELEEFIRDRIILIQVAVGDEADAYLIFETLNDRGLDLSISDLLKNYLFGRAGNRLDVVRRQWQETVIILGTQDQTQFLRHYWLSRYGVVRERELYREMKRKFSSQSAVLRLTTELRDAAENYAAISSVDHPTWKEYGSALRKNLETLQLFGLSQFKPLLLAALDSLEEDEIPKLVHAILVVSMRYSIIGSLGTGNIEKAYSDAAIRTRAGKTDTASKIFNSIKNIYPDDRRFESDFVQKEITKAKLARYILSAIANKLQGSKELGVLEDEKVVTLEHIMPKTKPQEWLGAAKDDEEYIGYVNRLGNLTLIEREKNRVANNASFTKKKADAFSKSDILITKELCDYADWTVSEIVIRQKKLAKTAVKIWSLPY